MYHTFKHYTSISDIAAVLVYRMFLWCVKIYDCYVLCKVAMVVYNTHVQLFKKLLNNFCSCLVCCFDIKLTITISVFRSLYRYSARAWWRGSRCGIWLHRTNAANSFRGRNSSVLQCCLSQSHLQVWGTWRGNLKGKKYEAVFC